MFVKFTFSPFSISTSIRPAIKNIFLFKCQHAGKKIIYILL
jgi:hypothetical protein